MAVGIPPSNIAHVLANVTDQIVKIDIRMEKLLDPAWIDEQRGKLIEKRAWLEEYRNVIAARDQLAKRWERATQLELPDHDGETGEVASIGAAVARRRANRQETEAIPIAG